MIARKEDGRAGAMRELVLVDEAQSDQVRDLVSYWENKRGARFAPARADLDPLELPTHLPRLTLVDVVDGGRDFRFRLVGTAVVEGIGRDPTGERFSNLYSHQPGALAALRIPYQTAIERRGPVYVRGRVFWMPKNEFRRFEGALLPLSSDGAVVDMILVELVMPWPPA